MPRTHGKIQTQTGLKEGFFADTSSMSHSWTNKRRSGGYYPNPTTSQPPALISTPLGSGSRFTASIQTSSYLSSTLSSFTASTQFLSKTPMVLSSQDLENSTTTPLPLST